MNDHTSIKADIIPYTPDYAREVRSWIDSPETLMHLCRSKEFPPAEDIVDSWQRSGVSSFIMSMQGKPVAYGELCERKIEQAVEICHLIVNPRRRDEGLGSKMLQLLYERAATRAGVGRVIINLFTGSQEALACYMKAGFEVASTTVHTEGLVLIRTVQRSK